MISENRIKLIWLIGSNATGKTTQSRLLHHNYSNEDTKVLDTIELLSGEQIKATCFENSCHVGHLKDNQCTGTDTINKKENLDASYSYCVEVCKYVEDSFIVADGILATYQWLEIFKQFNCVDIYVVLLQFKTLEENLRRIAERRLYKEIDKAGGPDVDDLDEEIFKSKIDSIIENFDEKTFKNVGGKFRGFKSLFEKVKSDCFKSIEIDASLSAELIKTKIVGFIT